MYKLAVLVVVLGCVTLAGATAFTPGNLAVVRIGDGSAALTSAAQPVFINEYDLSGNFVQALAMPTSVGPWGRRLTNSGTATSEGFLTRSVDGFYLTLAGYDAALGTASVAGTTSAAVNRVVGVLDLLGTIDTLTALGDAYNTNNIRSAVTTGDGRIWTSGTGSPTTSASVRFTNLGGTTSVQLSTMLTNTRVVNIYDGQLYTSSASSTYHGVSVVGIGLPDTGGQTVTLLPGFPSTSGPSPYDFYFASADTLYVADDRTPANGGGIQKWQLISGTWTLLYTLTDGVSGCRGLTGTQDSRGAVVLYATTGETTANRLVTVTDTGPGSVFTTLATAPTNQIFRGVDFTPIPEPSSLLLIVLGALGFGLRRR